MQNQPQPLQSAVDDHVEPVAESVQFGLLLNNAYFYSAQLWISQSEPLRAAASAAWRQLRMQCLRLTTAPLKGDMLDRIVRETEEELLKTLCTPWHLDAADDLRESLSRLPDDMYYDAAEELLYKSFLRPVRELCDEMLRRFSSHLGTAQCSSILLGAYLCAQFRADYVWLGMYAATSAGALHVSDVESISPARAPTPDDFGLNSVRGEMAPLDESVRDGLPTEMIDYCSVRLDEHELELLRQRIELARHSWELACETLFEGNQQVFTESAVARYVDALRNVEGCGRTLTAQQENYLGIRFDGMKLYAASGQSVDFGRSVRPMELAKSLVAAGAHGLSRREVIGDRDVTDNSVDQDKRELNIFLRQVNLEAQFENRRLVIRRRRMA